MSQARANRRRPSWLFAFLLATALACAADRQAEKTEVVVFAAASLKEVFGQIAAQFEADHAGTHVGLQLAGSQELRTQLENGARADVFAAADLRHMVALRGAKLVRDAEIFARNEPVVIVAASKPAALARFEDLPKAERIIVGTPEVPIGGYTVQILANAARRFGEQFARRVEANIASKELNVRQILAKVSLGEGDAGFVYRTDAIAAGERVRVVEIPAELNVVAEYPIAVVEHSSHPDLARAWIDLVLSDRGQSILSRAGFRPARKKGDVAS